MGGEEGRGNSGEIIPQFTKVSIPIRMFVLSHESVTRTFKSRLDLSDGILTNILASSTTLIIFPVASR